MKYCFNLLNLLSGWGMGMLKLIIIYSKNDSKVTRLCLWQRKFCFALLRSRLKWKEKIWDNQVFLTIIYTGMRNLSSAFIPDWHFLGVLSENPLFLNNLTLALLFFHGLSPSGDSRIEDYLEYEIFLIADLYLSFITFLLIITVPTMKIILLYVYELKKQHLLTFCSDVNIVKSFIYSWQQLFLEKANTIAMIPSHDQILIFLFFNF